MASTIHQSLASGDDATVTVNITERKLHIKQAGRTAAQKLADDEAFMDAQVKAFNQRGPAQKRPLPISDVAPPEKAVEEKAAVGQCRLIPGRPWSDHDWF